MMLSIRGRFLAGVAGCAFAAGGLTILLGSDLTSPQDWQASQWLTILTVFGTIAAGHLMVDAARARHLFATLGFLVLFLSGTGLVVYSSVGRQVETAGTTTLSVEDNNTKIADKTEDLKAARARRDYADRAADREMTGQRCGQRCKDWKTNAKDIGVVIKQLEGEIAALGPQKPVNAQAAAMADIGVLFRIPASKDQIVAALLLLIPFAKCLFFEIGSIVSLGFAFRQGKRPVLVAANDCPSVADDRQTSFPVEFQLPEPPEPPKGKRRKPEIGKGVVDLHEHRVWKAIERNGGSVSSHQELADLLGIDPGPASRLRQEIDEHLELTKVGKQLRIALRA
jgi:hypothetical protein